MKIWIKMIIAIILGLILGIFFTQFKSPLFEKIFHFISNISINFLLYLTLLYVLIKGFIGFLNLKRSKISKKILMIFFLCILISVGFSTIISIGFMNLNIFQPPENDLPQISSTVINISSFENLFLKIINDNIFLSFQGPASFILPIIFIGFIFAIAAFYTDKKGEYFIDTIESFDEILDKIIRQILEFFPIGAIFIFTLFINDKAFYPASISFIIKPLLAIIIISIIIVITYIFCLYLFLKKNAFKFLLGFLGSGLISFVTGNSIASIIPLTEHLKKNIGVKKDIADTLGPIGLIINKSGTIIVSTIVLISLVLIYSEDKLNFNLQLIFFFLIFIFSFCLDGATANGFLMLVATILNFQMLQLEQYSYLLFINSIPILSRIGTVIDSLSTAAIVTITSYFTDNLENKRYVEYI